MKISQDPTTLTEFLKQDSAARQSEKAITQVTTAELGLNRNADDANRADVFFGVSDSVRISASAAGRYRMFAGAKTADEQKQQTAGDESFTRRSYAIGKVSREAAQAMMAAAREGGRETGRTGVAADQAGAAEDTRNRYLSGLGDDNGNGPEALDLSEKADEAGASGGDGPDALRQIKERIREVQQLLSEAQTRLAQAASRLASATRSAGGAGASATSGASATPDASATSGTSAPSDVSATSGASMTPDTSATSGTSATFGVSSAAQATASAAGSASGVAAAEAAVAGAQTEVEALTNELMKLNQELQKIIQDMSRG